MLLIKIDNAYNTLLIMRNEITNSIKKLDPNLSFALCEEIEKIHNNYQDLLVTTHDLEKTTTNFTPVQKLKIIVLHSNIEEVLEFYSTIATKMQEAM